MNVPHLPEENIKGFRVTRQGLRVYRDRWTHAPTRVAGLITGLAATRPTGIPESGTDFGALAEKYVSICPLQLDLTAYPAMHILNHWPLCREDAAGRTALKAPEYEYRLAK